MSATTVVPVEGMSCQHCVNAVTEHVQAVDGVTDVKVDLDTNTVTVDGGERAAIVAAIEAAGYQAA